MRLDECNAARGWTTGQGGCQSDRGLEAKLVDGTLIGAAVSPLKQQTGALGAGTAVSVLAQSSPSPLTPAAGGPCRLRLGRLAPTMLPRWRWEAPTKTTDGGTAERNTWHMELQDMRWHVGCKGTGTEWDWTCDGTVQQKSTPAHDTHRTYRLLSQLPTRLRPSAIRGQYKSSIHPCHRPRMRLQQLCCLLGPIP